jgi:prolyl oligopeptidase
VNTGGGKLFATYLQDATNRIYQLEYDGSDKTEIALPGLGSAGGLSGKKQINCFSILSPPTFTHRQFLFMM